MDVDTVLVSVQERDKWRRRLGLLQESLTDLKDRRTRVEARLRKIKRDLARLSEVSDAVLAHGGPAAGTRTVHASTNPPLPAR
jgi:hypothetical protein